MNNKPHGGRRRRARMMITALEKAVKSWKRVAPAWQVPPGNVVTSATFDWSGGNIRLSANGSARVEELFVEFDDSKVAAM